ncbi:MAG TPA: hypothetical protein DCR43_00050 [Bacteroidales bacterium]|nr:MAG: hypothetical protein A2X11_04635 [Bacteroidetes bacterium GWE2_42_24]OFY27695.1 MAG: hypothetical protein A2X09_10875 [Bacteroidetes bacterium GWF2_43_11]HAQ64244.1 hypothetical protein [Bacteroidales bacterium]HBZ66545.1 hypothetical protein [Bacteroidales bacterium]
MDEFIKDFFSLFPMLSTETLTVIIGLMSGMLGTFLTLWVENRKTDINKNINVLTGLMHSTNPVNSLKVDAIKSVNSIRIKYILSVTNPTLLTDFCERITELSAELDTFMLTFSFLYNKDIRFHLESVYKIVRDLDKRTKYSDISNLSETDKQEIFNFFDKLNFHFEKSLIQMQQDILLYANFNHELLRLKS